MCRSTFGCRRRRFIDLADSDSSRVFTHRLWTVATEWRTRSENIAAAEVLCCTVICSTLYVCRSSDWSRFEEQLQQRSARAFRPFDAGPCEPEATNFILANAQRHHQRRQSRVGQLPFRYPHAFNCFTTTTYRCGTHIFDSTYYIQRHIRNHEARQVRDLPGNPRAQTIC